MKNARSISIAIAASAGLALPALAQTDGDVLFLSNDAQATAGASQSFLGLLDVSDGTFDTLFSSADPESRLNGIALDSQDNIYFGDSPFPVSDPSVARINRVENAFSGAPSTSIFVQGDPIQNTIDIDYDAARGRLLAMANPVNNEPPVPGVRFEGILGIDLPGGGITEVYEEPAPGSPRPRWVAGDQMVVDPFDPNTYYVTTIDGGENFIPDSGLNSVGTFQRVTIDPGTGLGTAENLGELLPSVIGTSDSMFRPSGLTADNRGNIYIGDIFQGIVRVLFNPDGSVAGSELVADLATITSGLGLDTGYVNRIAYDRYNNRIVIAENVDRDGNGPTFQGQELGRISAINLDGSGYQVLLDNVYVNDLEIVPAPATAALLGLGGLMAARRRR